MAVKTFTDNTTLPASDINTFLANSGLTYISTTSFTTSSTIQFVGAFSDTYTNYRAVFSYLSSTGAGVLLRWLVGTTVQTGNIVSQSISVVSNVGAITAATRGDEYGIFMAAFPTYPATASVDIYNPKAVGYSSYATQICNVPESATVSRLEMFGGRNIATTQIDGFEITTAGAQTLTGTMTLFGYRKA
jgi:hypothetical protein